MDYKIEHILGQNICTIKVSGEHKRPEDSLILQDVVKNYGYKLRVFEDRETAINWLEAT